MQFYSVYTYPFEKLDAWKIAKNVVVMVYQITSGFPPDERFGLTNQMRRAAVSISSNLAEGCGRKTPKDQAHFYNIAYSSIMELLSQLIISVDLNFLGSGTFNEMRLEIERLSAMINSLRKPLLSG